MSTNRSIRLSAIGVVALLLLATFLSSFRVNALNTSSLTLSDSRPGEVATYTFDTSGFSGSSIQCFDLELNTQADGLGSAVGTTTSYTLGTSTAIDDTLWTEDTGVNGRLRATYGTGEIPTNGNIVFNSITNGSTGATYFAIFTTYTDSCSTIDDTVTVSFIYKDGALVSLTIDPSLTFTVGGVAASAAVNGATTSVLSTPTAINFQNEVTSLANGISAHDLTVGTNATGGYTLYIKHTGLLTNGASDTIDNWTGTNAAPTTIAGVGTELWGYTTEDGALLTGTADRFTNGGAKWSGFNTVNEIVGDSNAPTASTITRVGHQVGVSASTEAGTYQTTIVYTVASVY